MKRADDTILLGLVLLVCVSMLATCEADAQTRPATDEETLAALCVHEAGWDSPADCWGIFAQLSNQGELRSITWRAYLERHFGRFRGGLGRNPWAIELRDSDRRPPSLDASWLAPRVGGLPSRRARFGELVRLAFEIVRSAPVCGALFWGNEADYRSGPFAEAHRHDRRLACGNGEPTRNVYSAPGAP